MRHIVLDLDSRHIRGTEKEAMVHIVRAFVCHLTMAVCKRGLNIRQNKTKVYISTRVLKHIYDKRPAQEYDFLVEHLHLIVKYPDHIYNNKQSKRGDYCFVKTLNNTMYLCCLEVVDEEDGLVGFEIVTFYRVTKEKYLESYELLWSWRDDTTPHRSAFDSDLSQPSSTPQ